MCTLLTSSSSKSNPGPKSSRVKDKIGAVIIGLRAVTTGSTWFKQKLQVPLSVRKASQVPFPNRVLYISRAQMYSLFMGLSLLTASLKSSFTFCFKFFQSNTPSSDGLFIQTQVWLWRQGPAQHHIGQHGTLLSVFGNVWYKKI